MKKYLYLAALLFVSSAFSKDADHGICEASITFHRDFEVDRNENIGVEHFYSDGMYRGFTKTTHMSEVLEELPENIEILELGPDSIEPGEIQKITLISSDKQFFPIDGGEVDKDSEDYCTFSFSDFTSKYKIDAIKKGTTWKLLMGMKAFSPGFAFPTSDNWSIIAENEMIDADPLGQISCRSHVHVGKYISLEFIKNQTQNAISITNTKNCE